MNFLKIAKVDNLFNKLFQKRLVLETDKGTAALHFYSQKAGANWLYDFFRLNYDYSFNLERSTTVASIKREDDSGDSVELKVYSS